MTALPAPFSSSFWPSLMILILPFCLAEILISSERNKTYGELGTGDVSLPSVLGNVFDPIPKSVSILPDIVT